MRQILKILDTFKFSKDEMEQNRMILDMVNELAINDIDPLDEEWETEGAQFNPEVDKVPRYPKGMMDVFKKAQENDLFFITVPTEYEGFGLSYTLWCAVIELVSRASHAFSMFFPSQSLSIEMINKFGTPEAKQNYIPKLGSGDAIGAMAFTEPGAGSDISAVSTKAVKEGDNYLLTGSKVFLTHGGTAGTYIGLAVTDKEKGPGGLSAFVIDPEIAKDGFEVVRIEEKMGIHGSITAQVALNDAIVPATNLLGKENGGLRLVLGVLASSRIGIAAQSTGVAEAALQQSIEYVKQRSQFGRPLAKFQATQFKLADMATKVHQARLSYLNTAHMKSNGLDTQTESSISKLYCSEIAQDVTYDAVQLHGGYGYVAEYPVERYFRNARVLTIYEGSSEMQSTIIGRAALKRSK